MDKGPRWAASLRHSGLWRAPGGRGAQPHSTYPQNQVSEGMGGCLGLLANARSLLLYFFCMS